VRNARGRIDPLDLSPVREFWARPIGHHSPKLEAVLSILRGGPVAGKYCLMTIEPHAAWAVGRMSGIRGIPPALQEGPVFDSIEDAERHVFRLRWEEETGCSLPDDKFLRAAPPQEPHP
jgi:hypothetical protein